MKKRLMFCTWLVVFSTITSSCIPNNNVLQQFESKLSHSANFRSVSLIKISSFYMGLLWIAEGDKAIQNTLMLRPGERNTNWNLSRGWINVYDYVLAKVTKARYMPNKVPDEETKQLQGNLDDLKMMQYPWRETPRRFLLNTKYAKNVKFTGAKDFGGYSWEIYHGEYDLTKIDAEGLPDSRKGTFEIWIRSDSNAWVEIYKGGDGAIVAVREGELKLRPTDHKFEVVESASQLMENYLLEYRNSIISHLVSD
ncbi:MAG: hypothetical protein M1511_15660 [Deltaproteobacteria bacterium]|nr:hypothetical protein [Deltaproteobacteria bacterium]